MGLQSKPFRYDCQTSNFLISAKESNQYFLIVRKLYSSVFQYLKERKFFIMKKVYFLIVLALLLGLLFTGCGDIAKITVNTDEELYKSACYGPETATGMGTPIKLKGTWFMYNEYPGGYLCEQNHCKYYIQAGNPKNGDTLIGSYWVEPIGGGWYVAKYELDGFEPSIDPRWVIVEEHLAIDNEVADGMDFKAIPGQDDNQNFFEPFYDEDGLFFIFAHFAMDCAGQLQ